MNHFSKLPFYSLLASSAIFAAQDVDMKLSNLETKLQASTTSNPRGRVGAKLAPGACQVDGYGFYLSADLVTFQLLEDNSHYATQIAQGTPTTVSTKPGAREDFHASFDWSWGFKAAAGYYAEHDKWQTGFEFTYLQAQTHGKHAASFDQYIYSAITFDQYNSRSLRGGFQTTNANTADRVDNSWKVSFYNLDWTLGKNFFISKYFNLIPNLGIKSSWWYQTRKSEFIIDAGSYVVSGVPNQVLPFHYDSSDDYVGVGPKGDLTIQMFLGKHVCLLGKIDAALLYATNRLNFNNYTYENNALYTSSGVSSTAHQRKHHISPYLGFDLGISYDTNYDDDKYNFAIKLSYEQQYYNKASRMMYLNAATNYDVSFQAVDLSFKFSF